MPIRLPSRLHRNRHGVFGFRVVIPSDVRIFFTSREYRLSLCTSEQRLAARISQGLSVFTDSVISLARSMKKESSTNTDLIDLLSHLKSEKERLDASIRPLTQAETDAFAKLLDARIPGAGEGVQLLAEHQNALLKRRDALFDRAIATILSCKTDEEVDGKFVDLFARLAELKDDQARFSIALTEFMSDVAAQAADIRHSEEIERLAERASRDRDLFLDLMSRITGNSAVVAPTTAHQGGDVAAASHQSTASLQEVIDAYCDNQTAEGAWTDKTLAENRAIFNLWLRIVGDQSISSYGHEQHRRYKAMLQRLPPNLNKDPRYVGKELSEIVELGDRPAAVNTINKALTRVAALFNWAVRHGYTGLNPAGGMVIKRTKRPSEERHPFTPDDLKALFGQVDFRTRVHRESYMYWAPLIALYTGARLNEIAQLHLADFSVHEGIALVSVDDVGEGKRVKTKAAKRRIPLHPELLRLGLLAHVEALRKKGMTRLFPELKPGRDGYGALVSKWFSRYRKRCGITQNGKVFHSFRHTFIDRLKQAGVAKEHIASLVGHEDGSETFGRYGKDYEPRVLVEVVRKLDFDLDHLPRLYAQ